MKELVSKLSLYDILAMVIPGGLILWCISLSGCRLLQITDKALFWIVSLVFSYLIGLINHMLTSYIWLCFRNNKKMINEAKRRYLDDIGKIKYMKQQPACCLFKYLFILLMIYLLYMAISKVNVANHHIISLICFVVTALLVYVIIQDKINPTHINLTTIDDYYKAYYNAMQYRYSDDIPIMESQVAFIQNLTIPIIVFIFIPLPLWIYGSMKIIVVIMLPLLFWTICNTQMKIYTRVWEDNHYLQIAQHKSNNSFISIKNINGNQTCFSIKQ